MLSPTDTTTTGAAAPAEQLELWYNKEFARRGQVPTRPEAYAKGISLGLKRSETDTILSSHPERTRNIPGRQPQDLHQLRLFSSAQCDLGFLNLNKKNYGIFFIGTVRNNYISPHNPVISNSN